MPQNGGKAIFAMDFQNDGEFVGGCIAGGRNYCHINPKGDVEPCVFIHYSGANIREKSLLECLKQPLFMAYRDGQPFNDNMLRPCPMLENPELLQKMVHETGAKSTDLQSPETVEHLCGESVILTRSVGQSVRINSGASIRVRRKAIRIINRNKQWTWYFMEG